MSQNGRHVVVWTLIVAPKSISEISFWSDRPDDMRPSEGEALALDFEKDPSWS